MYEKYMIPLKLIKFSGLEVWLSSLTTKHLLYVFTAMMPTSSHSGNPLEHSAYGCTGFVTSFLQITCCVLVTILSYDFLDIKALHSNYGHDGFHVALKSQTIWCLSQNHIENRLANNNVNTGLATPNNSSQNVMFRDVPNQWDCEILSMPDDTYNTSINNDLSLTDFFSRPIKIYAFDWNIGASVGIRFDPWSLFFSNPRVINRITNYNLLRCKLKLKFIINGTIFHYSRVLVSYLPLPGSDKMSKSRTGVTQDLVEYSQRPHIFLDPTYSQGGVMSLPFFWYKNWLNIPNSEWTKMGDIFMDSMADLKHANGADSSVNISVFAWAEDVVISVPTTIDSSSLVIQSGDEYGQGIVSKPATAIAKMMGMLNKIPVIGPYARATQMLANTTADVASAFGYSRPPVMSDISYMRPTTVGNLANADMPDSVFKLSIDAKQELSIDSRTVGLSGEDEMTIKSVATRPSYLTKFSWVYGTAPETHLFSTYVCPTVHSIYQTELHTPACCFASLPFTYWHSSMIFRFQIVSSAFHKGRLKFVYDPGSMDGITSEYNTVYTRIVDISEEKDFQMTIGWGNERTYLQVPVISSITPKFSTGILPVDRDRYNGTLSVFVVNELAVPSLLVNSDISINVYVSCGEDVDFAVLTSNQIMSLSYFPQPPLTIQIGDVNMCDNCPGTTNELGSLEQDYVSKNDNMVFFGETLVSFRKLLKRYQLHGSVAVSNTTGTDNYYSFTSQNYPLPYGYATNGVHVLGTTPCNIVFNTLLNYLTPAYVGLRGAIRYKYRSMQHLINQADTLTVTRSNSTYVPWNVGVMTYVSPPTYSQSFFAVHTLRYRASLLDGGFVTVNGNNPAAEIELPHYDNNRFMAAKNTAMFTDDISLGRFCHRVEGFYRSDSPFNWLQRFVSVGEDFSLFFFTGAPVMYQVFLAA